MGGFHVDDRIEGVAAEGESLGVALDEAESGQHVAFPAEGDARRVEVQAGVFLRMEVALDVGCTMLVAKTAQQAADQAMILRKVSELALNPGMNIQDGMLTTHSERTYFAPEAEFLREFQSSGSWRDEPRRRCGAVRQTCRMGAGL